MYDKILRQIANCLFINIQNSDYHGLLRGKLGVAMFFYYYSRYLGNTIYSDFGYEYIEYIYDKLGKDFELDFVDGLSGIGWAIEHLTKNKFVEVDDDEDILEEIDSIIKKITDTDFEKDLNNSIALFSKGLYFVQREDWKSLSLLLQRCEEFIKADKISDLPIQYLNSVAYCLIEYTKHADIPEANTSLFYVLTHHINNSLDAGLYLNSDILLLKNIHRKIKIINEDLLKINIENISVDTSISLFETGWSNFIYGSDYAEDLNINIDELYKNIELKLRFPKAEDLILYRGLAGLGIELIRLSKEK